MSRGFGLIYAFSDAARSLRGNLATTVLSAFTVAFTLAIFGLFLTLFVNLNAAAGSWGDRTRIAVYIKDGALKKGVDLLEAGIREIPGVRDVRYVSKKEALEILKKELGGNAGVLDGVEPGILPASFEISLDPGFINPSDIRSIVNRLGMFGWVDDVQYGSEWVEKFSAFLRFVEVSALFVGVFLVAATVFIISNTIRLTVYARREEIEIMRYLGAPDLFIKIPFFMEGVAEGVLGGVLALGILFAGRHMLGAYIPPYFGFLLDNPFSPGLLLLIFVASGLVLGGAGSLISMGRFLKV